MPARRQPELRTGANLGSIRRMALPVGTVGDMLVRTAVLDWIMGSTMTATLWTSPVLLYEPRIADRSRGYLDPDHPAGAFLMGLRFLGIEPEPLKKIYGFLDATDPLDAYNRWQKKPWDISQIGRLYGNSALALFSIARRVYQIAQVAAYLSGAHHVGKAPREVYAELHRRGEEMRAEAAEHIEKDLRNAWIEIQDRKDRDNLHDLSRSCARELKSVEDVDALLSLASCTLCDLVPDFGRWMQDARRAHELQERLDALPSGRTGWAAYEELCLEIANFIFRPACRRIYAQARTGSGLQRRDLVIPNTSSGTFWRSVREQLGAKNLVIELKNLSSRPSGGVLNQLRVYLDKPTIGKFGMLWVRRTDGGTWAQAQRDAYAERGHLILVMDDRSLRDAMLCRAFFGTVDLLLEDLKVQFEVGY